MCYAPSGDQQLLLQNAALHGIQLPQLQQLQYVVPTNTVTTPMNEAAQRTSAYVPIPPQQQQLILQSTAPYGAAIATTSATATTNAAATTGGVQLVPYHTTDTPLLSVQSQPQSQTQQFAPESVYHQLQIFQTSATPQSFHETVNGVAMPLQQSQVEVVAPSPKEEMQQTILALIQRQLEKQRKPFIGGSMETQIAWERSHVCCYHLQNDCRFGDRCRYSHDIQPGKLCHFGLNCKIGHASRVLAGEEQGTQ